MEFGGTAQTLEAGVTLSVGTVLLDPGRTLSFATDLTYDGALDGITSTLSLNDHTLTLSAASTEVLSGGARINGGTLVTQGGKAVDNFSIANGATLDNQGTVTVTTGNLLLGNDTTGIAMLLNESGSTFDILGNFGISPNGGSVAFINQGIVEKTAGTGLSLISVGITDTGTILVSSGSLNFTAGLTNDGLISAVTGGTLVVANLVATDAGLGRITLSGSSTVRFNDAVAVDQTVDFLDSSGHLALRQPSLFDATVEGFQATAGQSDSIEVAGFLHPTKSYDGNAAGGTLALKLGTTVKAAIKFAGDYTADDFALSDTADGTLITALCFLPGTRIATPSGEIPVEKLAVGDQVLTAFGGIRPIIWIGFGRVLATRGKPNAATPVIIRKSAFAPNIPSNDLRVTKSHSFFFDGVLIPIEFLVNHRSILRDDQAQEVTLYHIELETHDVLLANGAPAESYRDDGNRWLFHNANTSWNQPPKPPCAPVETGGVIVDRVWRELLERSGPRPDLPLTNDPDLRLQVDSQLLAPASSPANFHLFRLSKRPDSVRILSRSGVPQELGFARDPRCLGVALHRVIIRGRNTFRVIHADDPRLCDGFYPFEAESAIRWTDGDAILDSDLFAGFTGEIEVVLVCAGATYCLADGRTSFAA
jgi:Hint domain